MDTEVRYCIPGPDSWSAVILAAWLHHKGHRVFTRAGLLQSTAKTRRCSACKKAGRPERKCGSHQIKYKKQKRAAVHTKQQHKQLAKNDKSVDGHPKAKH